MMIDTLYEFGVSQSKNLIITWKRIKTIYQYLVNSLKKNI